VRLGRTLLAALLALAAPAAAGQAGKPAYLAELQARAERLDLAGSRQWHALLHYDATALGGWESRADDPEFFFAEEGKHDPAAELAATLRAFFRPSAPHQPVGEGEEGEQHPQCAFPARYAWLKRRLDFDPARLPERPCPRFEWWRGQLDAAGVTLVFPAAYLNNPSSLFGHTLLRLDRADQTPDTRLLAYAVNYAAHTGSDGGMMFAVKGLTGLYPGYYSIAPYYEKIKYYSDLESRDVWEYELNLKPAEVARMVRHVWELRGIHYDYYFFDENCASQLLALLEAARPSLELVNVGRFDWWSIPADTVRAVEAVPGLVGDIAYRPSLETKLVHRARRLPAGQRSLARRVALGEVTLDDDVLAGLPETARARSLELGYTYIRYLKAGGEGAGGDGAARARDLLVTRSRLDVPELAEGPERPAVRPDQGHRSARLALTGGVRDGHGYQEVRLRPAYHNLMDPGGGYVTGAQISLFDTAVRRYHRRREVALHGMRVVEILSLSPRDRFRKPVSWKINTAVDRYPAHPERDLARRPWRWRTNGGAGLTWDLGGRGLAYAFLEATADVSRTLDRGFALGAGPAMGLVADPLPRWRLHLRAVGQRFVPGDNFTQAAVRLDQRLRLSRNHALRLSVARRHLFDRYWNEGRLGWHWYL
jgi:hypothetical protein